METQELYREILNEHNINPSHKTEMADATISLNGVNPSCGDNITLNLKVEDGKILYDRPVRESLSGRSCRSSGYF